MKATENKTVPDAPGFPNRTFKHLPKEFFFNSSVSDRGSFFEKDSHEDGDRLSLPITEVASVSAMIQKQEGVAIARTGAFWFATQAITPGEGGFSMTNCQFQYLPHPSGEERRKEISLLKLNDIGGAGAGGLAVLSQQMLTAGTGFSNAEIRLRISYDGQNIRWGETELISVDGYEGGNLGSEANLTFSAIPASHREESVASVRITFSGWTNPIGAGFHRFNGSLFIDADGRVREPEINIVQGGGWAVTDRTDFLFEVGWLAEPEEPYRAPSLEPLFETPSAAELLKRS